MIKIYNKPFLSFKDGDGDDVNFLIDCNFWGEYKSVIGADAVDDYNAYVDQLRDNYKEIAKNAGITYAEFCALSNEEKESAINAHGTRLYIDYDFLRNLLYVARRNALTVDDKINAIGAGYNIVPIDFYNDNGILHSVFELFKNALPGTDAKKK